ncbi:P-loop containing nucleoside triphosphate hydrolase protein [Gaertneriomyces semiglobifer]|nr:P-loop containing nucleoside triphosphate hydrolase protein [Gaertneriomyces semiglobifer]
MIANFFLFDETQGDQSAAELRSKSQLFGWLSLAAFIAAYTSRALWVFTAERQIKRISVLYLRSVLHHDMGWFDCLQGESLSARLQNDIPLIREGIGQNTGILFSFLGTFVSSVTIAVMAQWKLALVMLALMPLLLVDGFAIIKVESLLAKQSGIAFTQASALAEQAISGIRTIHAFSLPRKFLAKYEDELGKVADCDVRKAKISGFVLGSFTFLMLGIFAFGFWVAGKMVVQGDIGAADAVVVVLSMMVLAGSLMSVPAGLSSLARAKAGALVIYNIISIAPNRARDVLSKTIPLHLHGEMHFQNVYFSYPARPDAPVLQGLTLHVKAGQTVAFVGASGSGKSTIMGLLLKYYTVFDGGIKVDGRDLRTLDPADLRTNIGLVGQEPVLFALTIKQNILLGATGAVPTEKFMEVCRMAQCHDFVSKFPQGYDTPVTEGSLSGGQKQRIAIARALIKDPKILLLDENTKSERLVQKALDKASQGRTTIVIAHRLSTVRHADVICVMKDGQIVEKGNHDELYGRTGLYTELRKTLLRTSKRTLCKQFRILTFE